jgi:hypothetical protein
MEPVFETVCLLTFKTVASGALQSVGHLFTPLAYPKGQVPPAWVCAEECVPLR